MKRRLEGIKNERTEEPLSHEALLLSRLSSKKEKAPPKIPEDQPSGGESSGALKIKKYTLKNKDVELLVAMGAFHLKRLDFLNHILSRPEMDQQEEFETFIDQAKGCFMTLPEINNMLSNSM